MKKITTLAIVLAALILTSCSKENLTSDTSHQTIFHNPNLSATIDYLATENDISIFYDAIIRTKMDIEIIGNGPYTIFAPNNESFEKLFLNNNWNSIDEVPIEDLKRFVQYHISKREVTITDLIYGKYIPTLFKERELFIDVDNPNQPFLILGVTKANVIKKDAKQNNGMVNKIDKVLSL